jgi:hypothetical protein
MMGALRGYAHVDPAVAYHLWVLVFPIVWATLEKQQQINLAKPIIQLLSKEYHQRQAGQRPNVIQVRGLDVGGQALAWAPHTPSPPPAPPRCSPPAPGWRRWWCCGRWWWWCWWRRCTLEGPPLHPPPTHPSPHPRPHPPTAPLPPLQALLEGISLSQPQPKIPPELIKFLGRTYNAWHIATPLLESHVLIFPDETRCFDALVEVYRCGALACLVPAEGQRLQLVARQPASLRPPPSTH